MHIVSIRGLYGMSSASVLRKGPLSLGEHVHAHGMRPPLVYATSPDGKHPGTSASCEPCSGIPETGLGIGFSGLRRTNANRSPIRSVATPARPFRWHALKQEDAAAPSLNSQGFARFCALRAEVLGRALFEAEYASERYLVRPPAICRSESGLAGQTASQTFRGGVHRRGAAERTISAGLSARSPERRP